MFKVLVVDDDPNVSLFLSRLLQKKFSCTVQTAYNGADALSKLKSFDAEIMFLDITMPVMDGVETIEALRADEKYKDIPIIVLTAISEKNTVAKVMSMGVIDYMLKPLMYEQSVERLQELLDIIRKKIKKQKEKEILSQTQDFYDDDPSKEKFLIATPDKAFNSFFAEKLSKKYKMLICENGADALKYFMKYKPKIVLLGENLPLLNEKLLAQKLATSRIRKETEVFLIKDELSNYSHSDRELYDHVIEKKKTAALFK